MKKLILFSSMLFLLFCFVLIIPSYAKAKVTQEEYEIFVYRKKEELQGELSAYTIERNLTHTVYPIEKGPTYDKFMKYTYVISDDSVIGLGFNYFGAKEPYSSYLFDNNISHKCHEVTAFGLAPGTATLKIYDG